MKPENRNQDSGETWRESDAFVSKLAESLHALQNRFEALAADIQMRESERETSFANLRESVTKLEGVLSRLDKRVEERFAGPSIQEVKTLREELSETRKEVREMRALSDRIAKSLNLLSKILKQK